jgi:tetratricopeptide (TPR) repeat protein
MNQEFNPVFAFKKIFPDGESNEVIGRLFYHSIIWDFLSNEKTFLSAVELFGDDPKRWAIENIVNNVEKLVNPDSTNINDKDTLQFHKQADELRIAAQTIWIIREKRIKGEEWSEIFQNIDLINSEEIKVENTWELVFSCFSMDEGERIKIENALFQINSAEKLLGLLVKQYQNKNLVSDFALRNIDKIINNPNILKKITFNLFKNGGRKIAYQLVREYLDSSNFSEYISTCDDGAISFESIPETIEKLNEFHQISSIINDDEKMKTLKNLIESLLRIFHRHKIVRLYEQNQQLEKSDLLSLDFFLSIKDQKSYIKSMNKPKSLVELFLAFDIMDSNVSAARELCEKFYEDVKQSGLNIIIFSSSIGYLLDPIDIAKLFINVGMEFEAIDILENEISEQNHSINPIKFLAHYSNILGNHKKSKNYYSYLFALGAISREEKVMFCQSLKYLGLWEEVYSIRKTINPLNTNDEIERAISAYEANELEDLDDSIQNIASKYPNNDIMKSLEFMLLYKKNQHEGLDDHLSKLINNPNKEIRSIILIESFLNKKGDFSRIEKLIELLPKKYKKNPEIQLLMYRAEKRQGNYEASIKILINLSKSEAITKQNVFEEIICELLENGLFANLRDFLKKYANKWKLSPVKNLAYSKVLLEAKDFTESKKKILNLLENENPSEEKITIFGCCLLETSLINLPFRNHERNILAADKTKFQELIDDSPENERALVNKILRIEICEDDKEIQYINLYEDKSLQNTPEFWRIPFGLGLIYFEKKLFDQAIIYFKDVQKYQPTHKILIDYLIQSYCQLKMPVEAIEIIAIQKKAQKLSLDDLNNYLEFLFKYKEFETFLRNSELEDSSSLMYSIALAKLASNNNDIKSAEFQLSKIESRISLTSLEMLAIAQIYLDCGINESSRRILEKFLSKKSKLDTKTIITSAALYYQLEEYEKAQNLIDKVKSGNKIKSIITADILEKRNQVISAIEVLESVFTSSKQLQIDWNMLETNYVNIPSGWSLDLQELIFKAASLSLATNNFEKAFEVVGNGIKNFPNRNTFDNLALKISYLEMNMDFIREDADYYSRNSNRLDQENTLLLAGFALENDQEILAARYFSQLDIMDEKEDRLNLLIQARLLLRNSAFNEANDIYQDIILNYPLTPLPEEISSSNEMKILINHLFLGETAFEFEDIQTSFDISRNIYLKFGSIARSNNIYIKSLTKMLERNRLFEIIYVKNHLYKITEDDLNILSHLLSQEKDEFTSSADWKNRVENIINPNEKNLERVLELHPTVDNIHTKIFALSDLGRINEVENLLEMFKENEKVLFTYAINILNKNPEITQSIILKILEDGKSEPIYLAALSFAYEKLGNHADSYSSICLALNMWPNEYEWEIFAGNLSKRLGNNLASFSHFKNAENYNKISGNSLQIIDLPNDNIKFLEKSVLNDEILNSAKDIPQLLKIIDLLIEKKRFEEIYLYLNKLKKYNTNINYILIIEAKIALIEKRYLESSKQIETVLQNDHWNLDAIILKSKIIAENENTKKAIDFLESIDCGHFKDPTKLIIQKANLIEQSISVESAIDYLINEDYISKDSMDIDVCLANLYLNNGNPLSAQDIATDALNQEPDNPSLLNLLGNISKDLGDLDKAIDYLLRSITIDPFYVENYIQLSEMFESRRDYKDSLEILIKGLEFQPDDYSLLRYTGLLFYRQGKYLEAHVNLIKALNINPKDSDLTKIIGILDNSLQMKKQKTVNQ